MDYLNEIAKHHKDWVRITRSFGGGDKSEDIVQEMYLKLHRLKIMHKPFRDGKLNKSYITNTLYTLFIDYYKETKRIEKVSIEGYDIEYEEQDKEIETKIIQLDQAINNLDWYSAKMMRIHLLGKPMRTISEETGIGLRSVWGTINEAKKQIKEEL